MRSIDISTDVFAAIWRERADGEETEDQILRRILATPTLSVSKADQGDIGFADTRYGVSLPTGFEVFRTYKGEEFRAVARDGGLWLGGKRFGSFTDLSKAIGTKIENAWMNWHYLTSDGRREPVALLRSGNVQVREKGQWLKDIQTALEQLGGEAALSAIYTKVRSIRDREGRSLPVNLQSLVRKNLEEHSSQTDSYRGKQDLFVAPKGLGKGYWALKR